MKSTFLTIVLALSVAGVAQADTTAVQIKNVHLCCQSCVKGLQSAVAPVKGVTTSIDKDGGVVSLTGPDAATVQKAVDAMVGAGYYGESGNSAIKINTNPRAKGEKVQSLKVDGVHLCCGKCVNAVNDALAKVPGVTGNTATKGAKSFTVTGDFKDTDVFNALQKEGLSGHVGQ
jgi:copper chaperone CopZ